MAHNDVVSVTIVTYNSGRFIKRCLESVLAQRYPLKEIIVVLTKGMLTDQLAVVGLAREHFRVSDLKEITRRRIGRGKVGGKAVLEAKDPINASCTAAADGMKWSFNSPKGGTVKAIDANGSMKSIEVKAGETTETVK